MPKTAIGRLAGVLLAFGLVAGACSSGDAELDTAAVDVATTAAESPDDLPLDPAVVEQLGRSLTGADLEGADTACILERADRDLTLTGVLANVQDPEFQFADETFTALATAIHACVNPGILAASVLGVSGATSDEGRAAFSTCVNEAITDAVAGDLAYTGLAALNVSFPVPAGAAEATIDAARTCVNADDLIEQFAAATEAGSGFTVDVDRACMAESVDDSFLDEFWPALVNETGTAPSLETTLTECSSAYDSGLDPELPVDFVPWSGAGALAMVDPGSRAFIYTDPPPMTLDAGVDYSAVFETGDGTITIDLFEDVAPITVNNFVSLAREGYYDATFFHRVIDGFMAQGGDPTNLGTGGPGYVFDDEETGLTPIDRRGLLAMANSGSDTNGGQFFITFAPATHLDGNHTVFGEVVDGDDVLAGIDLRDPQAPASRGEPLVSVTIVEG